MDPNREILYGAQQNIQAIQAFEEYHGYLEQWKKQLDRALLVDLHGRAPSDGIIQLGYCLRRKDLDSNFELKDSSIATLAKDKPGINLITGPESLGAFMENEGLKAVPSPQNPKPGTYFLPYFGPI